MRTFVTGISTDVGKTIATGIIAKDLYSKDKSTITMKLVQTGCKTKISEDILTHRKIMGISLTKEDEDGLTCPYVFKYPSSPHLAAELEEKVIFIEHINECINKVSSLYNNILIEGVGGLYVPLNKDVTILDWLIENPMPVIVVTTPALGSINHTLLTIETLLAKEISVVKIIYNLHFRENDLICKSTFEYLKERYKNIPIVSIESI